MRLWPDDDQAGCAVVGQITAIERYQQDLRIYRTRSPRSMAHALLRFLLGCVTDGLLVQLEALFTVRLGQVEPVAIPTAATAAQATGVSDLRVFHERRRGVADVGEVP